MKTKLAVLAATTALGALIAAPAIGAIRTLDLDEPYAAISKGAATLQDGFLKLASNDDDDHERDDEDHDDDDDEDDDDDDYGGRRGGMNAAPAGTVAPPANGLFGSGAAPKVKVN
ncbi:hypothetical protein [Stappia sp. ES.058]|uniref:hypothetical protein n=1 Tax=Stappia sp. ES.058 TaxID=1881061 RepID=UPI00087D09AE|nr:hypothetical protein [Stappia sp. ES.058]SDU49441.1 hypothetical protein SAMN05428979_4362 [Stappia sp. ES.058]